MWRQCIWSVGWLLIRGIEVSDTPPRRGVVGGGCGSLELDSDRNRGLWRHRDRQDQDTDPGIFETTSKSEGESCCLLGSYERNEVQAIGVEGDKSPRG